MVRRELPAAAIAVLAALLLLALIYVGSRGLMHMAIFWGVLLSCAITFPLTFGWIRFTLVPPDQYQLWFFGFPVFQFPIQASTGFALFHALDFSALLLIVG